MIANSIQKKLTVACVLIQCGIYFGVWNHQRWAQTWSGALGPGIKIKVLV